MTDTLVHHLKEGAPPALGPDDSELCVSGQIADAIIASGLTDRPISDLIEQVMGQRSDLSPHGSSGGFPTKT